MVTSLKKTNSNKRNVYKSKKKQSNIQISELIITILILILLCVNLVLVIKKVMIPDSNQQKQIQQSQQQEIEQSKQGLNESDITSEDYQLSLLKEGTERDRIEYYCGQFFKFIENKNYTKAYELLYPEFKQQYFPTIEEFTKYIQKTYPSILAINYDDFDRQGNIYITTVLVDDALATDKSKQFSQRIVVQESDYNKYVLSFQVI